MIVVRVELHSALTGQVTELARMDIWNEGHSDNPNFGDYGCQTNRGRNKLSLAKRVPQRTGRVIHHARLSQHVWNLVAKALRAMEYGSAN